jgi:hypothetical protein
MPLVILHHLLDVFEQLANKRGKNVGVSHIIPLGDGCLGVEACGKVDVTTGTCSAGSWIR